MQTRFQLFIDKYAGYFLCAVLLVFVRAAGKILRINHNLNRPINRIVVCKLKGLGSIVQASALINTLRKNYPDADIRFISSESNKGLLDFYSTQLTNYWLIRDRNFRSLLSSSISTIFALWKFRPQVYIDLEIYSNYSSLLCTLSAATNRLGYYKSDKDYRTGLYTHLMYYNIKAPLAAIYLQMARILQLTEIDQSFIYPKAKPETSNSMAKKALEMKLKPEKPFIIINPNASDLRLERRWPRTSFIRLIEEIRINHPEIQIVLIGNKQESEYVGSISEVFKNDAGVIDSSGKFSLGELICLFEKSLLILTNDTGPLHLSLALKKPTIGLFGPCSPMQYSQMESCRPIYLNMYCSPCVHEFIKPPCGGDNQCMKRIEVASVLDELTKLMMQPQVNNAAMEIIYNSDSLPLGFINNR
jgi:ADP-heptose:LPS heptosyltransferase